MATPHVAGAAALLWSAAPSLIGDIDETRRLLNEGARDVDDTHCGGTAGMNNVWGEGKLDILASIDKAPHTAVTVSGKVTDRATGKALSGIAVQATDGSSAARTVSTASDGSYRLALAPGTYSFELSGYGYADRSVSGVELTTGTPLAQDIALDAVTTHPVTGTVLDVTGKPLARATVEVTGTPVPSVTSGTDGTFTLPHGRRGQLHADGEAHRPGPVQRDLLREPRGGRRRDPHRPAPGPLRQLRQQLHPGGVLLDQGLHRRPADG